MLLSPKCNRSHWVPPKNAGRIIGGSTFLATGRRRWGLLGPGAWGSHRLHRGQRDPQQYPRQAVGWYYNGCLLGRICRHHGKNYNIRRQLNAGRTPKGADWMQAQRSSNCSRVVVALVPTLCTPLLCRSYAGRNCTAAPPQGRFNLAKLLWQGSLMAPRGIHYCHLLFSEGAPSTPKLSPVLIFLGNAIPSRPGTPPLLMSRSRQSTLPLPATSSPSPSMPWSP